MKNRKLIAALILLPLSVFAAAAAYISWLFPLKKGTKNRIFVPIWGKILLCRFADQPLKAGVAVVSISSGDTIDVSEPESYETLSIEDIGFSVGNVFDEKYVFMTQHYYDTDKVSYKLFLTEYNKYKDKIKNLQDE